MPAGFGVWDGGRSTAAEERILRTVPFSGSSPDELAGAAATALQRLAAAGALRSPDVTAPLVTAHPVSATRGKVALLHFDLFDDSGQSKALVRIYEDRSLLATLASPAGFRIGTRQVTLSWRVPAALRSWRLRFCASASRLEDR